MPTPRPIQLLICDKLVVRINVRRGRTSMTLPSKLLPLPPAPAPFTLIEPLTGGAGLVHTWIIPGLEAVEIALTVMLIEEKDVAFDGFDLWANETSVGGRYFFPRLRRSVKGFYPPYQNRLDDLDLIPRWRGVVYVSAHSRGACKTEPQTGPSHGDERIRDVEARSPRSAPRYQRILR